MPIFVFNHNCRSSFLNAVHTDNDYFNLYVVIEGSSLLTLSDTFYRLHHCFNTYGTVQSAIIATVLIINLAACASKTQLTVADDQWKYKEAAISIEVDAPADLNARAVAHMH